MLLINLIGCVLGTPATPADSDLADTEVADTDVADDTDCRLEGESCTATEDDFNGNCCNGRHTCFPEGCFYTAPTE